MNNIENNQLVHSACAINVTHQFYDKKFMLYVEGDDDIVFWDEHFKKYISSTFYEIEQVHGKENLARYLVGIKDGTLQNVVVACDSDFTLFLDIDPLNSPFIIKTYGHSIENTMFCPYSVAAYIRRLSKTTVDYSREVLEWLTEFSDSAKKLLPYEIENEINPAHCSDLPKVFNKGFCFYQDKHNKIYLDKDIIDNYIKTIISNYSPDRIQEIVAKINEGKRDIRFIIQGHFIADAMMNYIRMRVKQIKGQSVNVSNDAMYESIVDCKHSCSPLCNDKLFLKAQIEKLYEYYR